MLCRRSRSEACPGRACLSLDRCTQTHNVLPGRRARYSPISRSRRRARVQVAAMQHGG